MTREELLKAKIERSAKEYEPNNSYSGERIRFAYTMSGESIAPILLKCVEALEKYKHISLKDIPETGDFTITGHAWLALKAFDEFVREKP